MTEAAEIGIKVEALSSAFFLPIARHLLFYPLAFVHILLFPITPRRVNLHFHVASIYIFYIIFPLVLVRSEGVKGMNE